jgi:hypothetical protein
MSQLAQTRPRSAAEIIDATFRFYRARFSDLAVVAALLLVPLALLSLLVPESLERLTGVVTNVAYAITNGAVAILVAAAIERNESLSAGEVFRRLGTDNRTSKVIGAAVASGLLMLIGLVLLIVPGIFAISWTMVAVPVAAIEGLWIDGAIKRSRALARGRMGHVLGTAFLSSLIFFVLFFGSGLMLGMLGGAFGLSARIITTLARIVIVPLVPLFGISLTLLYYDLRVRAEGADVAAMIDALPTPPAEPA